jgi:DNA-binding NarL/FixJ family response regulator
VCRAHRQQRPAAEAQRAPPTPSQPSGPPRSGVPRRSRFGAQTAVEDATSTVPATQLPQRERDVIDLVAEGLTNADIAARLRLSETTVTSYLSASFARLGVSNRVQAALIVWRARP